jgi:hypothetical protein
MKKLAFAEESIRLNPVGLKSHRQNCLFLYFLFLCGLFLRVVHKTSIQGDKSHFLAGNNFRRGVRVAEGARLESVYTRKGIAGSNPALSAFAR